MTVCCEPLNSHTLSQHHSCQKPVPRPFGVWDSLSQLAHPRRSRAACAYLVQRIEFPVWLSCMSFCSSLLHTAHPLPPEVSTTPVAMAIPRMMNGRKIASNPMIASGSCMRMHSCQPRAPARGLCHWHAGHEHSALYAMSHLNGILALPFCRSLPVPVVQYKCD